jgi:hypothetical protein
VAHSLSVHAADWTQVNTSQSEKGAVIVWYLDVSSIRVRQGFQSAWLRKSYSAPQIYPSSAPYLSSEQLWLYDCKEERIAILTSNDFSGENGTGTMVDHRPRTTLDWLDVAPESILESMFSLVCGHK